MCTRAGGCGLEFVVAGGRLWAKSAAEWRNSLRLSPYTHPTGPELMQMEPHDAVDKLRLTLKVLGTLKSYYFEYKGGWLSFEGFLGLHPPSFSVHCIDCDCLTA